jgi:hypothetical protein
MPTRTLLGAFALSSALWVATASAQIFDYGKYPDLKGQWDRAPSGGGFDQTRRTGRDQRAPLTPEYQALFEENLADQEQGGQGLMGPHARCVAAGMRYMMVAFRPIEFIITPATTYIVIADYDPLRRIFTDGRDWPATIEPSFAGYSIGKWIDEDGDGKYDVLEVETRGFKGPRVFDTSGLPLHDDNQSIFKERIFLDKSDANVVHDQITAFDNALTRPWSVDKRYVRSPESRPDWPESTCPEYNGQVFIGKDHYFMSGDGFLMPAKPGQAPPDLRYFNTRK